MLVGYAVFLLGTPYKENNSLVENETHNTTIMVDTTPTYVYEEENRFEVSNLRRSLYSHTEDHNIGAAGFALSIFWPVSDFTSSTSQRLIQNNAGAETDLTLAQCDNTLFPVSDWSTATSMMASLGDCGTTFETDYILSGNQHSTAKYLEYWNGPCISGSCDDEATMRATIDLSDVYVFYLQNWLDLEQENPQISDMVGFYRITLQYDYFKDVQFYIKENIVNFLNGTTEKFYTVADISETVRNSAGNTARIRFRMSEEYTIYDEYVFTQPILDETRRLQDTVTETSDSVVSTLKDQNLEGIDYYLFLAAQVGGVYFLFYIIFGLLLSTYERKMFLYDSVNKYHKIVSSQTDPFEEYECNQGSNMYANGGKDGKENAGFANTGKNNKGKMNKSHAEFSPLVQNEYEKPLSGDSSSAKYTMGKGSRESNNRRQDNDRFFFKRGQKGAGKQGRNKYACGDFLYYLLCPIKTPCCRNRDASKRSRYQRWQDFKKDMKNFEDRRDISKLLADLKDMHTRYDFILELVMQHLSQNKTSELKLKEIEEKSKPVRNDMLGNVPSAAPSSLPPAPNAAPYTNKIIVNINQAKDTTQDLPSLVASKQQEPESSPKKKKEEEKAPRDTISNLFSKSHATSEHKSEIKSINKIVKREVNHLLKDKDGDGEKKGGDGDEEESQFGDDTGPMMFGNGDGKGSSLPKL